MDTTFKYLISLIFLTLVIKGSCESCPSNSLEIAQRRTGAIISGKPQWKVSVINHCNCVQSQITFSCGGFQTAERIDPLVLKIQGNTCLLFNGHGLAYNNNDEFTYSWDAPYHFATISTVVSGPCNS
ncbi:hypothetical protein P8452_01587 [Trifolium repens]|nr:hypothetical protein P8452_01587 [Trifolium repens]